MDEKDDEIAHLSIVARTANARNCDAYWHSNWHNLAIRHRQAGDLDLPKVKTQFPAGRGTGWH
jgi:hypothetical protein